MKIVHTSDWHIGKKLHRHPRHEEFDYFFDWLIDLIEKNQIDILIIAGDIFDSVTPGNRSQDQYFNFLARVSASYCSHVVITAGNHDSPSLLNAPKGIMKALNIHVVGNGSIDNPADDVLVLKDKKGEIMAFVCAAPYLRDREIRSVEAGEKSDDCSKKMQKGISDYYSALHDAAFKKKNELQSSAPVIVMGHLFAAGGKTVEGDGVRDLYVGTLEHVPASVFKSDIDYLALGHLHSPQKVGGKDYMRYCGSPLPMSFGETGIQKKVIEVCWDGNSRTVKEIDVPCFQRLERIEGDIDTIKKVIKQFKNQKQSIWLEIEYTGDDVISSLSEQIIEMTKDSLLEVLLLKNRKRYDAVLKQSVYTESLDDFNELQVFTKFLDINRIEDGQRPDLIKTYKKVLQLIHEDDKD